MTAQIYKELIKEAEGPTYLNARLRLALCLLAVTGIRINIILIFFIFIFYFLEKTEGKGWWFYKRFAVVPTPIPLNTSLNLGRFS